VRPLASREKLSSQNFAQPSNHFIIVPWYPHSLQIIDQLLGVYQSLKEAISKRLFFAIQRMASYIGDIKTQSVLIRIIRVTPISCFKK
jgi:hypothetical protein